MTRKNDKRAEREVAYDLEQAQLRSVQAACHHFHVLATNFHFATGKVLEVTCHDCGATNDFFEEN